MSYIWPPLRETTKKQIAHETKRTYHPVSGHGHARFYWLERQKRDKRAVCVEFPANNNKGERERKKNRFFFILYSFRTLTSDRRSACVPTRITGVSGEWLRISGIHLRATKQKHDRDVIESVSQERETSFSDTYLEATLAKDAGDTTLKQTM